MAASVRSRNSDLTGASVAGREPPRRVREWPSDSSLTASSTERKILTLTMSDVPGQRSLSSLGNHELLMAGVGSHASLRPWHNCIPNEFGSGL